MVDDYTWTTNNGTHNASNGAATNNETTTNNSSTYGWIRVDGREYTSYFDMTDNVLLARAASEDIGIASDNITELISKYWALKAARSAPGHDLCQCNGCMMDRVCDEDKASTEIIELIRKQLEELSIDDVSGSRTPTITDIPIGTEVPF